MKIEKENHRHVNAHRGRRRKWTGSRRMRECLENLEHLLPNPTDAGKGRVLLSRLQLIRNVIDYILDLESILGSGSAEPTTIRMECKPDRIRSGIDRSPNNRTRLLKNRDYVENSSSVSSTGVQNVATLTESNWQIPRHTLKNHNQSTWRKIYARNIMQHMFNDKNNQQLQWWWWWWLQSTMMIIVIANNNKRNYYYQETMSI